VFKNNNNEYETNVKKMDWRTVPFHIVSLKNGKTSILKVFRYSPA
jgi:hypothetical protein